MTPFGGKEAHPGRLAWRGGGTILWVSIEIVKRFTNVPPGFGPEG